MASGRLRVVNSTEGDLTRQLDWQSGSHSKLAVRPKYSKMPGGKKLPKPGPAKLSKNGYNDVNEWLKCAFNNQYLPESVMKKLCEICKEYLMEGEFHRILCTTFEV